MPNSEVPDRLTLQALDAEYTPDKITVQFNPNELNRAIAVKYQNREILGLSHEPHEYLGTANQVITFSLFYNVETRVQLTQAKEAMQFLEALAYGPAGADGITTAAPSRVLIVWPNTLSIVARLTAVAFKHERFNRQGDTIQFSAACTFEESRVKRLTAQDVITSLDANIPPASPPEGGA